MGTLGGRIMGMGTLGSRITGMGALGSRIMGMGTLRGRIMGMGTLGSRIMGMGTLGGRIMGMGTLGSRIIGMGTLGSSIMGMGTLGSRITGMGALGSRIMGMGTLGSRIIGMGTLGSRRLLHRLLLCCAFWGLCLASDYDDYSQNSTNDQATPAEVTPCPRAIPGDKATVNNVTYLLIPAATRAQLGSAITVRLIPCLYSLVFLLGLPANALALWVLATRAERLTSTVFLTNLAAADLLLVSVLPFKISYYFLGNHWPFGEGLCRLTTAFFYGNMYCSVLLLTCISADRYLAVVHPFSSRAFRTPTFAAATCAAVWLCAAAFTLPLTLQQQSYPLLGTGLTLCHDVLPRHEDDAFYFYYFVALIAVAFLLPLLLLALSSGAVLRVLLRGGDRYSHAVRLTALVVLALVVFYAPSNVLLLVHYSSPCSKLHGRLYLGYMVSLALSTCNSCADPFIYYYVSEDFREKVRRRVFRSSKKTTISLKTSKETLPRSKHSLV